MNSSSIPKIPTLRDTLLKAAALNFENIFLSSDRVRRYALKKGIQLPPHLFEDIQTKGNEIGWPIADQFLKPCLACRDALNWINVDLLFGHYEEKDLVKIKKSRLPLKKFYFRVYRMTSKLMLIIRKYSRTLEILHFGFHRSKFTEKKEKVYKKPIKFPMMKKLIIDFNIVSLGNMFFIDLSSFSDTLESLNMNCCFDDKQNSLKHFYRNFGDCTFHKLKSFSILNLYKLKLLKDIGECKNLRMLCIEECRIGNLSYPRLKTLVTNLPFLEYLDLGMSTQYLDPIEFLKPKNLKYLSFLKVKHYVPEIESYAQTVCHGKDIDSVLTKLEYSSIAKTLPKDAIILLLVKMKVDNHSVTRNQWLKIEMLIIYLVKNYWMEEDGEVFLYTNMLFNFAENNDHRWSADFMGKFANLIVNFAFYKKMDFEEYIFDKDVTLEENDLVWILDLTKSRQLLNYMLEYLTRKPNSTIGKMYLNFLLLSNIYHRFDTEIKEFVDKSTKVKVFPSEYSEI